MKSKTQKYGPTTTLETTTCLSCRICHKCLPQKTTMYINETQCIYQQKLQQIKLQQQHHQQQLQLHYHQQQNCQQYQQYYQQYQQQYQQYHQNYCNGCYQQQNTYCDACQQQQQQQYNKCNACEQQQQQQMTWMKWIPNIQYRPYETYETTYGIHETNGGQNKINNTNKQTQQEMNQNNYHNKNKDFMTLKQKNVMNGYQYANYTTKQQQHIKTTENGYRLERQTSTTSTTSSNYAFTPPSPTAYTKTNFNQGERKDQTLDPDLITYAVDRYQFSYWELLSLEYDIHDFDPYDFIANVPPKETLPPQALVNRICIPKKMMQEPKMTLVLDLDETLVHCSTQPMLHHDFTFPVVFNEQQYQVYVRRRPHFNEFLRVVSKYFEVVVFTASHQVYADKLLDRLDKHRYIKHRLFRDSCVQVDGSYLKDLCVLGRNLAHTAIIDNSPQAFAYHIHNGIPIFSWYDDPNDTELLKCIPFLIKLSQADDVRPIIRQKFKFFEVINHYKRTAKQQQMALQQQPQPY